MDFLTKDSRGGASSTKPLVVVPWLLLCAKFLIAGMTLPYLGAQPGMGPAEFGTGLALVLAIWLGREGMDKGVINIGKKE